MTEDCGDRVWIKPPGEIDVAKQVMQRRQGQSLLRHVLFKALIG